MQPTHNDRVKAFALAQLLRQGMTERSARRLLGMMVQATFYKFRGIAVSEGWIEPALVYCATAKVDKRIQEGASDLVRKLTAFDTLAEDLQDLAPYPINVHVFPGEEAEAAAFGRFAAQHLKPLLASPQTRTCAVAFGSLCRSLIQGLERICPRPMRKDSPLAVLPLRGDVGLDDANRPTELAHELARVVNGDQKQDRWQAAAAAPPVVPGIKRWRRNSKIKSIDDSRRALEEYLRVFVDYDDWMQQLHDVDLIVTSVGPPQPASAITRRAYDLAGFDPKACEETLLGDCALVPVFADAAQNPKRSAIALQLIGPNGKDYQRIVRESGHVFVAAFQDLNRAACLLQLVLDGMVNHLVIDRPIAAELSRMAKKRLESIRTSGVVTATARSRKNSPRR